MTITEGNKLIADFMGYEYIPFNSPEHNHPTGYSNGYWIKKKGEKFNIFYSNKSDYFPMAKLPYSNSWPHIMKVIERIESLPIHTNVTLWGQSEGCSIEAKASFYKECFSDCWVSIKAKSNKVSDKLIAVWKAVVEFVSWYNLNVKNS